MVDVRQHVERGARGLPRQALAMTPARQDGVLPVLATVHSPTDEDGKDDALPTVTFPGSVREAVLGSSKESFAAATQDGNM